MSLNLYWFGDIANNPTYRSMSERQKQFLLPDDLLTSFNLPLMLMAAGIPMVTDSTCAVIACRAQLLYPKEDQVQQVVDRITEGETTDLAVLIRKYIGVSCNADAKTDAQWLQEFGLGFTSAQRKKMQREFAALEKAARES